MPIAPYAPLSLYDLSSDLFSHLALVRLLFVNFVSFVVRSLLSKAHQRA
jgi:hypothetical protein